MITRLKLKDVDVLIDNITICILLNINLIITNHACEYLNFLRLLVLQLRFWLLNNLFLIVLIILILILLYSLIIFIFFVFGIFVTRFLLQLISLENFQLNLKIC